MKLQENSIRWAIKHIQKFHDTDLFPLPREFELIFSKIDEFVNIVKNIDLGSFNWSSSRRFIVPKAELSYRVVTQLSPIDSVFLAALIYEIGSQIEAKRVPLASKKVFTYRFEPTSEGYLYRKESAWTEYWTESLSKINNYQFVTYLDIADFYNQIYHHTIENQLINCGIENQKIKLIMNLLNSTTKRVSRGVPIGPYSTHILAEMSLIPIDRSLILRGYNFIRFADDYLIFTNSIQKAKAAVYEFAEILDKEQRLSIQSQKTRIFNKDEFIPYANAKVADQPLNRKEEAIIELIKVKAGSDPYAPINLFSLNKRELKIIGKDKLTSLIESYLNEDEIDFVRIRWIYRRLRQLGTPNLVNFTILNFEKLLPALNDICHYLLSASDSYSEDWKEIGEKAFRLFELPIIRSNEYFQIAIVNLFSSNVKMNHFDKLLSLYKFSGESIKRKIILMANELEAEPWIREQKENIGQMNEWTKRAFYLAISKLPKEEQKFLIRGIKTTLTPENYLEHFILKNLE